MVEIPENDVKSVKLVVLVHSLVPGPKRLNARNVGIYVIFWSQKWLYRGVRPPFTFQPGEHFLSGDWDAVSSGDDLAVVAHGRGVPGTVVQSLPGTVHAHVHGYSTTGMAAVPPRVWLQYTTGMAAVPPWTTGTPPHGPRAHPHGTTGTPPWGYRHTPMGIQAHPVVIQANTPW